MRVRAPRAATWLADRFLTTSKRESLIGDLVEQYAEGRSTVWYWSQVLRAILASTFEDIVSHKMMALRALVLGLAMYFVLSWPVMWLSFVTQEWIGSAIVSCGPDAFWCQFWSNQFSAELFVYFACGLSSWMVAKLHRPHAVAAVFLYSAAVLVLEYGMIGWLLSTYPPPPGAPHATIIVVSLVSVLGRPLAVLVGGLAGARNQQAAVRLDQSA